MWPSLGKQHQSVQDLELREPYSAVRPEMGQLRFGEDRDEPKVTEGWSL